MAECGGVALISSVNNTKKWFIDSTATKHMTHDKSILMYYNEYQQPTEICLGDNTVVLALGEGMVRLYAGDKTDFNLELHKVLFVPILAKNLLSVLAMALMGAKVYFDKEKCIVMKDGKEFIRQLLSNKLYTVDTAEFTQTVTETDKPTPEVCHQRLGHLNNYVHQLAKKEMVVGMNYDLNCPVEKECKGCTLGKMRRGPFPKHSQHRATKPYEIIHSDICGPMQVASKGGSRYMLTFTDDFSRYTTVYFLKNKSEVLSKFKEHVNLVENQNGKVKVLRSDNGREYMSHNFANYCAEKGILHEFTSPYCPEQNGVAECLNRTILEATKSMIYQAGLPLNFWAEACNTAVYVHIQSPTTALKDKTPFECLFGDKPDICNLRIFGCVSYLHITDS